MTEITYTPGDILPDGTIYIGLMNGNHISVSTTAFPGKYTWDEAMALEKDGWVIPDRYECLMIYDFHVTHPGVLKFEASVNRFWSARRYDDSLAYCQWLDDGDQGSHYRTIELPLCAARRFKSFSDLIISSPALAEIEALEKHTGLKFPELKALVTR